MQFDGGRPPWVSALRRGPPCRPTAERPSTCTAPASSTSPARTGHLPHRPAPGRARRTPAPAPTSSSTRSRRSSWSSTPSSRPSTGCTTSRCSPRTRRAGIFREAEAELRVAVPRFDTGAWSLYSLAPRESDLGYHKLLRTSCGHVRRTRADRERAARRQGTVGEDPTVVGDPARAASSAGTRGTAAAVVDPDAPDPGVYCETAERFTAYTRTAPSPEARHEADAVGSRDRGARVILGYTLSKVATVTTSVVRAGRWSPGAASARAGPPELAFTPSGPGGTSSRWPPWTSRATGPHGSTTVHRCAARLDRRETRVGSRSPRSRGRSSTRARAASGRRRWPRRPPAAAPPRACARS